MEIDLRPFAPSDADWLIARHAALYAASDGFDDTFATLVAEVLAAFQANRDPARAQGWVAQERGGDRRLGSIFCAARDATTAQLRLFFLEPEARGRGLGRRMLDQAMGFARAAGYSRMTLWTHESHQAACALYARAGWSCVERRPVHHFGVDLVEQVWTIDL